MFQFRGLASLSRYCTFSAVGCPIRKSEDIMLVCSSPQLIAAYHVLHRLSEPRHPPCALNCFKKIRNCSLLPTSTKSYSVLQLIIPICQRAFLMCGYAGTQTCEPARHKGFC